MRIPRSFTLDPMVVSYIEDTRGDSSASERANELLQCAIREEEYKRFEREAASFYRQKAEDRSEVRAVQKLSLRAVAKD